MLRLTLGTLRTLRTVSEGGAVRNAMLHIGAAGSSLLLIYLSININVVDCGINKPLGEWLCDYCSMGG